MQANNPLPNATVVPNLKQAVVLIHGIGEQVPMDTLRGFVDAVWTSDSSLRKESTSSQVWSKPDNISHDFELRRLTTAHNVSGHRIDFFEFYWAHLMEGTTLSQVAGWASVLLVRWPSQIPKQFRCVWWTLVLLAILLLYGWIHYLSFNDALTKRPAWIVAGVVAHLLWLAIAWFLIHYAGDAARYLRVAPENIEKRRCIREAGVQLIQHLHESRKYERIVIVGHSLGTVIGYDILTALWTQYNESLACQEGSGSYESIVNLEKLARDSDPEQNIAAQYQPRQQAYFDLVAKVKKPWLVSDFITLGSPLAHGEFLLGRNATEFKRKKVERQFPTCPPELEEIDVHNTPEMKFSYKLGNAWVPHHAAVFAATRWTNLYFPPRCTFWGDLIGGPVAPQFGQGVLDLSVKTNVRGGFFAHTLYWELPESQRHKPVQSHIEELRKALRLGS